jgi:cell division topological specificity factor
MALLDFFRQRKVSGSASIAKERLQILVAHDRRGGGPSYLPQLQQDLLKVIRKYVAIDNDAVSVNVESNGRQEILELNIVLPD